MKDNMNKKNEQAPFRKEKDDINKPLDPGSKITQRPLKDDWSRERERKK